MKGKKIYWNHLIVHLILLAGVAVVVFPFLWMIFTSLKTTGEAMRIPPTIFPEKIVTDAYKTIVSSAIPFQQVYLNTILSTVITTVVQIIFCSMAGYAFARIEFPFKNVIFILVCFLQPLFGENCKKFLENVASPFWRKLQQPFRSPIETGDSYCRHDVTVT